MLAWLGVLDTSVQPEMGVYGWSRMGYIAFVAMGFAIGGVGSLEAAVYPQLALVWLVYPLAFHILLHLSERHLLSLGAMAVYLSFADSYQWHFRAVPDSLYRLLFLPTFFLLVRTWETRRYAAFGAVLVVGLVMATSFRMETPLYALPAVWLLAGRLRRRAQWALLAGGVAAAVVGWEVTRALAEWVWALQAKGFVLPGSGQDVPGLTALEAPLDGASTLAWAAFLGHLALARLWYAVTPWPALWSTAHDAYYALYIVPAYASVLLGYGSLQGRARSMCRLCLWVFLAGILLHVIVAVDPSMRLVYTPQVFLLFAAALAWPEAYARMRRLWRSQDSMDSGIQVVAEGRTDGPSPTPRWSR